MYFHKGGLVMWPLLACSITVIAIAIERFIYYKSVDSGAAFASRYCAAVRSGDFAVATELARKGSGQCAQMLADVAAVAGAGEIEYHGDLLCLCSSTARILYCLYCTSRGARRQALCVGKPAE